MPKSQPMQCSFTTALDRHFTNECDVQVFRSREFEQLKSMIREAEDAEALLPEATAFERGIKYAFLHVSGHQHGEQPFCLDLNAYCVMLIC